MLRLVLGSRNKKKLREIVELLGDLGLDLADLSAYPNAPRSRGNGGHVRWQRHAESDATRSGPGCVGDR